MPRRNPGVRLWAVLLLVAPAALTCGAGGAAERRSADALPGARPRPPELARELAAAVAARGPDYVPRTRHVREDGSPRYTNRLILETSPYLQQHAHNPVDWYPWGDEAFETARRLGRPVLLSIGYSTCHWCHVMEEESFEDEEIAAYLNSNYIAIKVDREERPDLDGIYMAAVQSLTGRGGWPMNTWLTADREPFYGGTYFPARDGDRGVRKGFLTLLRELKQVFDEQPEQVAGRAREIVDRIQATMAPASGAEAPPEKSLSEATRGYRATFDARNGGMRGAPKFPSNLPVRFLLWEHGRTGDGELLHMATLTLERMAAGGIYDQLAGGFHRYATDETWLVPHFEKMLYDNALLAVAYVEGFQAAGNEDFARVAREIVRYVAREMTAPDGGFYSATDADSLDAQGEAREGWFFTWTPAELRAVLGQQAAAEFAAYYGVTEDGNFEGRNILHAAGTLEEAARQLKRPAAALAETLAGSREKLYRARAARSAPLRDEKILAAWNGLMISAMARVGFVLADDEALDGARRAADFVLTRMRVDGRLRRSFNGGAARHAAYLEDYAFMIAGLLDLYEATGERRWIAEALELQRRLDDDYLDGERGGYFMTADDHESLLAREKPGYDGAEPSGNSVSLLNLARLAELTSDDGYRRKADALKQAFAATLARRPTSMSQALLALVFDLSQPREVVIVGPASRRDAEPFLDVLRRTFVPSKVVVALGETAAREQQELLPLLTGKVAREGKTTAYVCERGTCKLPATSVEVFRHQLQRPETASERGAGTVPGAS